MRNLLKLLLFFYIINTPVFAENNDSFLWDLTKDMTKAVASELVKSAVAEGLNKGESYSKSESEINRLNNLIFNLKRKQIYKNEKIKELEDNVNNLQTILSELKTGSTNKLTQKRLNILISDRWFVILGSYKEKDLHKAIARKKMLEKKRYFGVEINDTNDYKNLNKGWYFLNIGPLSKPYASKLQKELKNIIPDAYIKSGW